MMPNVLLAGSDGAASIAQASQVADQPDALAIAQGAQPPAMPAPTTSPPSAVPAKARMLFDEVKRLNAACVAAGGGVSGSSDCDQALAREEELAGLGYCIDYPNGEALVRCPLPSRADNEERSKP